MTALRRLGLADYAFLYVVFPCMLVAVLPWLIAIGVVAGVIDLLIGAVAPAASMHIDIRLPGRLAIAIVAAATFSLLLWAWL